MIDFTDPMVLTAVVFLGIAGLVLAVGALTMGRGNEKVENRLDVLMNKKAAAPQGGQAGNAPSVLARPLDMQDAFFDRIMKKMMNIDLLIEQADANFNPGKLLTVSLALAIASCVLCLVIRVPVYVYPIVAIIMGSIPLLWLLWQRGRRMKRFGAQLPEAMELMARALRSGQSLPASFGMVAKELPDPICKEFGRVAEEQNFGVSLDESLESLADRIPNLDLRFFVTAVILQRQTGGDLAEILDKIGYLVRERFKIWGQVQALTGEGRLSGAVLLAMPFALFFVMLYLNSEYTMMLINEPIGRKMIAFALVMQAVGAVAIKKIITIKV